MAYYLEDQIDGLAIGERRPTINEYFLSSYSMAVYDGCEFGCPYCDGWAYRMRPFNETVRVATDLPLFAEQELAATDRGDLIGITALTDPYQPAEATYRLTRQLLQRLADCGQPCLILTKSQAVLEDLVLLERINQQSLAIVMFTLLTIDPYLSAKLEEKAPPPALRLEAIAELKRAGIPVGVAYLPVIPYVTDTDYMLSSTLHAIVEAGADFVVWDYLNIPSERHRARINEMIARIGTYPPSYYRDLYGNQALPDATYRADRDRELLARCDSLNLPVRAPHALYAGKLKPQNEAALLLKHTAFRDAVQGRIHMARLGRDLANRVYRGEASDTDLRESPLYPTLREILSRPSATAGS
ncbi:MAG: radical SAM protein [Chloroflexi bacterium SZAS-1]|nr:radical SAM protein [Chloroflexi bacterium SZAS-1]